MNTLGVDCFLVVGADVISMHGGVLRSNGKPSVRVCKGKPDLASNEIAIRLHLDLPLGLFVKPSLSASVTVPEGAGYGPEIPAEVQDNITKAIRDASGMDVRLVVEGPTP